MDLAALRAKFPSADRSIFFDHASAGPISTDVADTMHDVVAAHLASGFQSDWHPAMESVRGDVARLINGQADDIAFTQNTAQGISLIANGLDWAHGDNVVLPALEFPSNYFPWQTLANDGVEIRHVPAPDGNAKIDDVLSAIDGRTRVVSISAVQYSTGYRYQLERLGEHCQRGGTLLVVDGTQSLGALSFDVAETGADVLAVSDHKWLLGPLGAGFTYLSPRAREQVAPSVVGWLTVREPFSFDYRLDYPDSADRYESGTENIVGTLGLGAAVRLFLHLTPQWVEQRVLGLTDQLAEGLTSRGYEILSDRSEKARSGILIFRDPHRTPDDVHAGLSRAGVRCTVRGGGLRLSPHMYNLESEVDAVLDALT
jgi:cysteine desulfurase / selenocysteine lyase